MLSKLRRHQKTDVVESMIVVAGYTSVRLFVQLFCPQDNVLYLQNVLFVTIYRYADHYTGNFLQTARWQEWF
jgi:hypothetical protein